MKNIKIKLQIWLIRLNILRLNLLEKLYSQQYKNQPIKLFPIKSEILTNELRIQQLQSETFEENTSTRVPAHRPITGWCDVNGEDNPFETNPEDWVPPVMFTGDESSLLLDITVWPDDSINGENFIYKIGNTQIFFNNDE